jgi:hypothetical protein
MGQNVLQANIRSANVFVFIVHLICNLINSCFFLSLCIDIYISNNTYCDANNVIRNKVAV